MGFILLHHTLPWLFCNFTFEIINLSQMILPLKNLKNVHWLYTIKNFKLSAVRLQPSMDKNGRNDNYNKYKNR